MRATRAYLASLGTTGLLVLAAFTILIAASALLAFNGWPGDEAVDEATPVLVDPGREIAPGAGPGAVAAEAAEAADDVAFLPDTAGGDGDGADDGPAGDGPTGDGPTGDTPDPPAGPGPDTDGPETPTDGGTPGGGNGGNGGGNGGGDGGGIGLPGGGALLPRGDVSLTDGLADGVQSATDFVGADTVTRLSPELGAAVTGTGRVLSDLVRGLDGTPAAARG